MRVKVWFFSWLVLVCLGMLACACLVYRVDPYMHYHKPLTNDFYYVLDNQRSQNDGIIKHFDYDAMIIGTSMTENFKTSEMDELFDCNSIKVPFSGGTFKEMNDNIQKAIDNNPNLRIVVRGLDMAKFFDKPDQMRNDLGQYPEYLYDANILNDVKYLLNKDILANRVITMFVNRNGEGFEPGITSFDDYSEWSSLMRWGKDCVIPDGMPDVELTGMLGIDDEERIDIATNIELNVVKVARDNPDIDFYYFITPYSAVWWGDQVIQGRIFRQIEIEQYIIEQALQCDNVHLYSINNRVDITGDLNNYNDDMHYGDWINSLILNNMKTGENQITKDNYMQYLADELDLYLNFDYSSLNSQEDYEDDNLAVENIKRISREESK